MKQALVIRRCDMPDSARGMHFPGLAPIFPSFYTSVTPFLVPRLVCETDSSFQQLLPYVILKRSSDGKYFCYSRGAQGGEGRLVGNLSIGVGGHVDTMPEDGQLFSHLQDECRRELAEEVGLNVEEAFCFSYFIVDPSNPVGSVHLGIMAVHFLADDDVLSETEPGIVERGQFLTIKELQEDDTYNRLENWSKLAVDFLSSGALSSQRTLFGRALPRGNSPGRRIEDHERAEALGEVQTEPQAGSAMAQHLYGDGEPLRQETRRGVRLPNPDQNEIGKVSDEIHEGTFKPRDSYFDPNQG